MTAEKKKKYNNSQHASSEALPIRQGFSFYGAKYILVVDWSNVVEVIWQVMKRNERANENHFAEHHSRNSITALTETPISTIESKAAKSVTSARVLK